MGCRLNRLDEPVFMAVSKLLLTEFGIHYSSESCEWFLYEPTMLLFFVLMVALSEAKNICPWPNSLEIKTYGFLTQNRTQLISHLPKSQTLNEMFLCLSLKEMRKTGQMLP